jgi:hypothetical protein
MDQPHEILPQNPLVVDLLGKGLIDQRKAAITRLTAAGLPTQTIGDLSAMIGVPFPCQTIEDLAANTESILFNPVSGLMYENRARTTLLQAIVERVTNGTGELAIVETDMNNLKGLNDIYGEEEANGAIRAFAEGIKANLGQAIEKGGREIAFAAVNMWGEGSDSIKLILIGPDIYRFTRDFVNQQYTSPTVVQLIRKSDKTSQTEDISGEWGFFAESKDNIKAIKESRKNGSASDLDSAGDLYTFASSMADEKMTAEKVRAEAELVNTILNTTNYDELVGLWKKIEKFSERIPRFVVSVMRKRMEKLKPQ